MKKINILFLVLAILTFMLPVHANCPGLPSSGLMGCQVSTFNSSVPWIVYAAFGIIIAFLIVGIAYMLSSAFNSSEMKAWSMNEFWQAITTVLIVFFILIAGFVENQAVKAFGYETPTAQGADRSPIMSDEIIPSSPVLANAYIYLRRAWCYVGGTAFTAMVGYSEFASVLRRGELTLTEPLELFGFYFHISKCIPEFVSGTFGKFFGYITDPLMGVTGILTAQMFLLCLIDFVGMKLLLPLGIVFRAIPFLRGFGTALLALSIGLYLIYPLTLLMNEKMVLIMNPDNIPGGATSQNWWRNYVPVDAAAYLGVSLISSAGQVVTSMAELVNLVLPPTFINIFRTLNIASLYYSMVDSIRIALFLVDRASFIIVILGAFLSFLSIVITFTVTREIARTLGSDINLNTLLKLL